MKANFYNSCRAPDRDSNTRLSRADFVIVLSDLFWPSFHHFDVLK